MKKLTLSITLLLVWWVAVYSQEATTRTRTTATSATAVLANKSDKTLELANGTRIAGELQNSVDVRKAKVGDQVVLRTTQAIRSNGRTLVNKGARLFGHITEVAQKSKTDNESRLGILFDRLESNSLEVPITASIVSVVHGQVAAQGGNRDILSDDMSSSSSGDDMSSSSSGSMRSTSSTQRGQSGGGLLGGVTSSVGGVVSGTTSSTQDVLGRTTTAVGSTVNGAANATGAVAGGTSRAIGRIQISESTDASIATGSVLSVRGDNLRLEKGTTFNLVVSQSATVTKN
ncbi:MAG TPA: hypothetical protein VGQ39_15795 [Pyrinomonadaceae bacterium]|nr:hypothetical protein [Pyrinomonadaceae bacterium]